MSTFPVPSPCILESGLISNDELTRARGDAKWRKVLVTKYMTRVVSPALCSRDDAEFKEQLASLCLDLELPIMIWPLSVSLRGGIGYFRY